MHQPWQFWNIPVDLRLHAKNRFKSTQLRQCMNGWCCIKIPKIERHSGGTLLYKGKMPYEYLIVAKFPPTKKVFQSKIIHIFHWNFQTRQIQLQTRRNSYKFSRKFLIYQRKLGKRLKSHAAFFFSMSVLYWATEPSVDQEVKWGGK